MFFLPFFLSLTVVCFRSIVGPVEVAPVVAPKNTEKKKKIIFVSEKERNMGRSRSESREGRSKVKKEKKSKKSKK